MARCIFHVPWANYLTKDTFWMLLMSWEKKTGLNRSIMMVSYFRTCYNVYYGVGRLGTQYSWLSNTDKNTRECSGNVMNKLAVINRQFWNCNSSLQNVLLVVLCVMSCNLLGAVCWVDHNWFKKSQLQGTTSTPYFLFLLFKSLLRIWILENLTFRYYFRVSSMGWYTISAMSWGWEQWNVYGEG